MHDCMNQDATKLVVNVWESWSFFLDFYGGREEFDGKSLRGFFLGVVEDEAKLASDKTLRTLLEGERKKKKEIPSTGNFCLGNKVQLWGKTPFV